MDSKSRILKLATSLFARQGLKPVPVSDGFRLEFFDKAHELRARPGGQIVPPKLLDQVLNWLADYRAEHPVQRKN